jgi:AcrR family transcriptional regulator
MGKWGLRKKSNSSASIEETPLPPDTRDRLIQVAKTLFAEKGFDGSTVKDIADKAKVNISLISYHFQGKEGLYRTCLEQFGKARLAATEKLLQKPASYEEFRVRLEMFVEEIFSANLEEPELSRIVTRECDLQSAVAIDIFRNTFLRCHETLVNFLKAAQDHGILRKELHPEMTAGVLMGGIIHLVQKDKINETFFGRTIRDRKYRESVIQNSMSFWLHGCATPTPTLQPQQIGAPHDRAESDVSFL